jgi:hypothetical protein
MVGMLTSGKSRSHGDFLFGWMNNSRERGLGRPREVMLE